MRYWDSSALVPCLIRQAATPLCERLLTADREVVTWWATPIECASALHRERRSGRISPDAATAALDHLERMSDHLVLVEAGRIVRDRALRLLAVHPIISADALQLAAALIWSAERPRGREFVTLDGRLATAAREEGFAVLPAQARS